MSDTITLVIVEGGRVDRASYDTYEAAEKECQRLWAEGLEAWVEVNGATPNDHPVDIWTLQLKDAVALTPTATLPLYVRSIQRRRNRVEVTYPDDSTGWVAASKLVYFKSGELSDG